MIALRVLRLASAPRPIVHSVPVVGALLSLSGYRIQLLTVGQGILNLLGLRRVVAWDHAVVLRLSVGELVFRIRVIVRV